MAFYYEFAGTLSRCRLKRWRYEGKPNRANDFVAAAFRRAYSGDAIEGPLPSAAGGHIAFFNRQNKSQKRRPEGRRYKSQGLNRNRMPP